MSFPHIFPGSWRAVPILGAVQICTWGTMFYPPVLTVPLIAAERGWSIAYGMAGFSGGLFVAGLAAPTVGRLVDRYGGQSVLPFGALLGAAGLVALASWAHPAGYFAAWFMIGIAMSASLYDAAFASLGRIFGVGARRPISLLTFIGGFASTVSWPVTHLLVERFGWQGTYHVYAAILVLVAAPLAAFALPRTRDPPAAPTAAASSVRPANLPPAGLVFAGIATAFAAYAFVPSGMSAHLLAIFDRAGLDTGTVVLIGMLFGPSQVFARLCEFTIARHLHPLTIARLALAVLLAAFAMLAVFRLSVATAALFAVMFGMANGLMTISRGTVPLALFGATGYGRVIGRIAGPSLVMQALAPLALAFVAERLSDAAALATLAALTLAAFACFAVIRRPAAS